MKIEVSHCKTANGSLVMPNCNMKWENTKVYLAYLYIIYRGGKALVCA